MKHRLVSVLAVSLAVWSCNLATAPARDVDLSVSVSPNPIKAGDTATIRVRAYNPTLDTLRIELNSCGLVFDVRDGTDESVVPRRAACPDVAVTLILTPRDSVVMTRSWPSVSTPGTYRVVGILDAISGRQYSDPVPVTIVAPS